MVPEWAFGFIIVFLSLFITGLVARQFEKPIENTSLPIACLMLTFVAVTAIIMSPFIFLFYLEERWRDRDD